MHLGIDLKKPDRLDGAVERDALKCDNLSVIHALSLEDL